MKLTAPNIFQCHALRRAAFATFSTLSLLVTVTALSVPPAGAVTATQSTYKSPQEAVDALMAAVKVGTADGIVAVLGSDGRKLASSGDPVADQAARQRFEAAYDEAHELKLETDTRSVLIIGKEAFPFPIPVVAVAGAWRFDTEAGAREILDRRIGENELAAIEVARGYVDAQREYADADRDGKGVQYARKLLSSEGQKDGLYWPAQDGEIQSPMGPLVANARAQGYRRTAGTSAAPPYHGYVFKILTGQGNHATGGAINYVLNGRMIGGFALVAAPAEYGNSGVMTFIVNQDGVVFEKDFGPDTSRAAATMTVFDPDSTWSKVTSQ